MRHFISLVEALSSTAIEKTTQSAKQKIEAKLATDISINQNTTLWKKISRNNPTDQASAFVIWLTNDIDPSPTGIYTKWLLIRWLKGDFRYFEDVYKAKPLLEKFSELKRTKSIPVDERDINKYSYNTLYDLTKTEVKITNNEQERQLEKELISSGQAEIFYDSSDIKIVIPHSEKASCYFGRNTQWCTSATNNNAFSDYYKKTDPLYIIIFKKDNKRWQFQIGSNQFMDEQDEEIFRSQIMETRLPEIFEERIPNLTNLYLLRNPSEEVQKLAVQQDGLVIEYIKNPSEEVQKLAVQRDGFAIEYIKNPSEEIQKIALQHNGYAIRFINNPSEEIQRLAVQQNGYAVMHIKNPSEEVQRLAVQEQGLAIQYIKNPSEELQRLAVQQNGKAIEAIKNPSKEIQRLALKNM